MYLILIAVLLIMIMVVSTTEGFRATDPNGVLIYRGRRKTSARRWRDVVGDEYGIYCDNNPEQGRCKALYRNFDRTKDYPMDETNTDKKIIAFCRAATWPFKRRHPQDPQMNKFIPGNGYRFCKSEYADQCPNMCKTIMDIPETSIDQFEQSDAFKNGEIFDSFPKSLHSSPRTKWNIGVN